MDIAVDPLDSNTVYVAWGDGSSGASFSDCMSATPPTEEARGIRATCAPSAPQPIPACRSTVTVSWVFSTSNSGTQATGNRWRTHLERTTNNFVSIQDLTLADVPDQKGTYGGQNPIGDYDNLVAVGQDFYGIFSGFNHPDLANFPNGVTYLRYHNFATKQLFTDVGLTTPVSSESIDPFFFHVVELDPSQDFYVRDWTTNAATFDQGQEPSTNGVWWTNSDVWNRLNNDPNGGGFNANDQPNEQVAQEKAVGHNYAFARISRKAAAPASSPDIQVTADSLWPTTASEWLTQSWARQLPSLSTPPTQRRRSLQGCSGIFRPGTRRTSAWRWKSLRRQLRSAPIFRAVRRA